MFLNSVEIKVLFVQATLLTKYFKIFLLNLVKLLLPLVRFRTNMARRFQTSCWNCDTSETEGKTFIDLKGRGWCFLVFEGWRVGLYFGVLVGWFFSPVLQIRKDWQKVVCRAAARKGQVLPLWNHTISFRSWCWDVWKSQQNSTSEESHIWALHTVINVSMWFKGKDGDSFSSLRTSVLLCGHWNIFVCSLSY